jgi:hypothetical protein
MPVCLTAGALAATLVVETFTLAWTHSIEKIRWEEDWQREGPALRIVVARIRGSGAGMEPPAEARLIGGVWHYRPTTSLHASVTLARAPGFSDYELCNAGQCRPLGEYLPGLPQDATVSLAVC